MRFIDNNDETITDTLTGLMWTKDAFAFKTKTWEGALSGKRSCKMGGHTDWRLPSVAELFSLIDYSQHRPALLKDHPFQNVQKSTAYWTSTFCACPATEIGLEPHAWYVYFHQGSIAYTHKVQEFAVWYVRGGK